MVEQELKHGDIINFSNEIQATYYIINSPVNSSFSPQYHYLENNYKSLTATDINKKIKEKTIVYPQDFLFKLASLVELSPNPIFEVNFQGKITYLNSLANQKFKDLKKKSLHHPLLKNLLDQGKPKDEKIVIREVKIGDEVFEQHLHYLTENKLIRSYIFDITDRKMAENSLHYQAYYDTLTDLPNRSLFYEKLSTALAKAYLEETLIAVMFIDLDGFKNINDTLGHTLGDELLGSFAQRLRHNLRSSDILARWGGDEFTILIPQIKNEEEIEICAKRVFSILQQPFQVGNHLLYLKASIGVAIYPRDGQDAETIIKNADAALYRTKEMGRNHYQIYHPLITSKTSERLEMENLLHQALEKDQFLLHYQPQINIKNQAICGMEALIRWEHPTLGLVSPAKFIPIAEESGLIISIGEWVLRQACEQNRLWQKKGLPPVRVAVNLSAQQFQQPNFVNIVTKILAETNLEPQFLELEITETTIMKNLEFSCQIVHDLKHMGVHISMDDFGTGYSSLGYLKQIPFNTIKIDQSFIKDLQDKPQDLAIISAVLAIGRGFNVRVIAEGVETQHQVELLRKLECEEMQGFKFSKPLKPEAAANFLSNHFRA